MIPRPVRSSLTGVLLGAGLFTVVPARATGTWYVGLEANIIKPASGHDPAIAGFNGWPFLVGRHGPRTLTATTNLGELGPARTLLPAGIEAQHGFCDSYTGRTASLGVIIPFGGSS